jgi:hypothetical protein
VRGKQQGQGTRGGPVMRRWVHTRIGAGVAGGYALVRVAEGVFGTVPLPGTLSAIGAALVLLFAAAAASLMPATRASVSMSYRRFDPIRISMRFRERGSRSCIA